jgi:hypothetical protein
MPALIIAFSIPVHAGDRVSIRVSPAVGFAPANLLVRATVDVNAENRTLEIIAESPDFYRSSEITLDGDHAAKVTQLQFKSLPRGYYEVRAVLKGVSGREIAWTATNVNIVGEEEF